MAKIVWRGIIKDEKEFPIAELPVNAVQFDEPETMSEMMKKALPFMVLPMVICFMCMFLKVYISRENIINPLFIPIGILIGLILILVHELLHAAAYPDGATVEIGIIPRSFSAFAVSTTPLSRKQFVFMSLLPLILGIIPLILFVISPSQAREINAILFPIAAMGMTTPYPDFYNIYNMRKQVPKGALIQSSGDHLYWYLP